VFFVCRVRIGLCDELIIRSGESYRLCVSLCDLETSKIKLLKPDSSWCPKKKRSIRRIQYALNLTLNVNVFPLVNVFPNILASLSEDLLAIFK